MGVFSRMKQAVSQPIKVIYTLGKREALNWMSDENYLRLAYYAVFKEKLDLDTPTSFSAKLQWLKLYDRKPEYTRMVDKLAVKEYVREMIGDQFLIPNIAGPWKSFQDIDFSALPNQFVLKCTHDSGGLVICKDKTRLDYKKAEKKVSSCLKHNFYWFGREWPYKNVQPQVFCEKYMEDSSSEDLIDYKVLCFNGEPRLIEVHQGRYGQNHTQDFYDVHWNRTNYAQPGVPRAEEALSRPQCLEQMLDLTKKLAANIPHVRIDWYCIDNKLYFGEITFFDGSGWYPFVGNQDQEIGQWIVLPEKTVC